MGLLIKNRNLHLCNIDITKDKQKDFLLISDVHFDSIKCDRHLLYKHLDEARERNADVYIFGDLFDLMQGKWDPRGNYSDLRPEYKSHVYVDEVISDVGEKLAKYADVIKFLGRGNHETNIEKRMMVSPLDRVEQIINDAGGQCVVGGYAGWIVFRPGKHVNGRWSKSGRFNMQYHHGYGGNAKRSKGVLGIDIDQKDFPDADFIVRGHDHQKWYHPVMVDRINRSYNIEQRTVHHMRLGSYKKLGDRYAGWATEKGFATPRLGGWWLTMTCERARGRATDYKWTVSEAI